MFWKKISKKNFWKNFRKFLKIFWKKNFSKNRICKIEHFWKKNSKKISKNFLKLFETKFFSKNRICKIEHFWKKFSKKFFEKFSKTFEKIFFSKIDFVEMIFWRKKKFKVQKIFAENREKFLVSTLNHNRYIVSTYIYILINKWNELNPNSEFHDNNFQGITLELNFENIISHCSFVNIIYPDLKWTGNYKLQLHN